MGSDKISSRSRMLEGINVLVKYINFVFKRFAFVIDGVTTPITDYAR